MMGLMGRERSLTMSSTVWIQYTNVTDGRTNRWTPDHSKDRAYAQRRTVKIMSLLMTFNTFKSSFQQTEISPG